MKNKFLYLFFLLFLLGSCSNNSCKDLPETFLDYETAITQIRNTSFTTSDEFTNDSWISKAEYYSCDGNSGFCIIEMNSREYIYDNMPIEVWENFKAADSKGRFFNRQIKHRYNFSKVQ